MTARRKPPRLEVRGALWLAVGSASLGGHGRIGLLRAVAEQGSITQAAKAFGISYKAAWDAVDAMNRLSGTPLVERVTGGRGGGATRLTEHGRRVVERYEQVEVVHRRFMQLLDRGVMDVDREFSLLEVLNMKTSARNQWVGSVVAIRTGAVNDEIELALPGGTRLVATITRESTSALALRPGTAVVALVKASAVMLAADLGGARLSARNQLAGRVDSVTPGAVNTEVTLAADGGLGVVATVSQAAAQDLALVPGAAITALIKSSDVLLAVAA